MGLSCLGATVVKRFKIIEPFRSENFIIKWLESQDWLIDPATTSNKVQNFLTILQYARDFHGESWTEESLQIAYKWLNEHQDKRTGLWGCRFDSPIYLSHGVQTGYHILLLYFYDNKKILLKNLLFL